MSDLIEMREILKNMSGDELAQAQNFILTTPGVDPSERAAAIEVMSQEINTRRNEGMLRKAERFMNRHGDKVGLFALGALLGVELND